MMKNTFLVLLGFAVGAYFAKREVDKFVDSLDNFHDSF